MRSQSLIILAYIRTRLSSLAFASSLLVFGLRDSVLLRKVHNSAPLIYHIKVKNVDWGKAPSMLRCFVVLCFSFITVKPLLFIFWSFDTPLPSLLRGRTGQPRWVSPHPKPLNKAIICQDYSQPLGLPYNQNQ